MATSRPCPSATCSAASSSPCHWPPWRCCSSSARSWRPGVPLVVGGAAVVVALAGVFLIGSVTPMSIFVLNLATLLGLGLGVDYSLLMTSRFREELARRPADDPEAVGEAVRITVATAGRAVFFSGLTVLLGPARPRPLRVHDPALGGHRRGDRRRAGGRRRADPAAGVADGRSAGTSTGSRSAASRSGPTGDGPWARSRAGDASPRRRPLPTLAAPARSSARRSCTSGSTRRTRRILPANVPSRAAFDRLRDEFGEGEFAPLVDRDPDRRARPRPRPTWPRLYDYSRRLAADPRVRRVDSLVDVDRRLTLAQYQLLYGDPNGPRDRFVAMALARHDPRRPDGVHRLHALRPEPRRGPGARRRPARRQRPARAAGRGQRAGRWRGGGRRRRRRPASPPTSRGRRCSSSSRPISCCSCCCARSCCPIKALVMNTLSIVASFGALVWIFQDGNLSAFLGFQPVGFVETTQPVILFCVLFGLSMDYEVFLLSRMKEVWDRDRRQHRGGRPRPRAERPDRDLGRAHRGPRGGLVRVRRHRADQGARRRDGDRGGTRRDRRPGPARAGHDAAARASGTGGCRPPSSGSWPTGCPPRTPRPRRPWRRRDEGSRRRALLIAVVAAGLLGGCSTGGGPILANPTAPRPSIAPPTVPPVAVADPVPIELPARRRAARPPDRVVVLHRPPARRDAGSGSASSTSIFRGERGAFPTSWASHLAITDETGDALPLRASAWRSGRRWTARRGVSPASRPASTCPSPASTRPTRPPSAARPGP